MIELTTFSGHYVFKFWQNEEDIRTIYPARVCLPHDLVNILSKQGIDIKTYEQVDGAVLVVEYSAKVERIEVFEPPDLVIQMKRYAQSREADIKSSKWDWDNKDYPLWYRLLIKHGKLRPEHFNPRDPSRTDLLLADE